MTFEVPIFWCVDEETQDKLKELMRKSWVPPVIIDSESPEEIDKLMRSKPRGGKE